MTKLKWPHRVGLAFLACNCFLATPTPAQDDPPGAPGAEAFEGGPRFRSGQAGPGRFGGPMQQETKVVKQFDQDGDGRLDAVERKAAREFLQKQRSDGGARRGFGPPGGPGGFGGHGGQGTVPTAGAKLSPAGVKSFPNAPLYEPLTLRTFFLDFQSDDWEKELADFHGTDVEVPAKLTVDGKAYPDVGVHFRGMSSYMMVGKGSKRSLNLSLDFAHKDQNIGGYRTINLLNSHEDPSFLRSVLSYQIDRAYIPAPKANLARVVINGESWGVYVNVQQFNKDFVKDWFGTTKGARWKVDGSPGGQGSLAYLGEDPAPYKRIYTIKTKDDPKRWADLIALCKVLNQTPANKLEEALAPLLDIDGALKFLALDNALINNDGYWIRSSDYAIYQDEKGRFHLIPQDSNETFANPGGPRFGGGPGGGARGFRPGMNAAPRRPGPADQKADPTLANVGGPGGAPGRGPEGFPSGPESGGRSNPGRAGQANGVELDPLFGVTDSSKPLISKLLAVPALRARYLGFVRDIAENWLDWQKLGPIAEQYQTLIVEDVKADTRKLDSTEAFLKALTQDVSEPGFGRAGGASISLKNFATQRQKYLLEQTAKTTARIP